MTWIRYVGRAFQVVGMLSAALPQMVADGKITVDEIVQLFVQLAAICNWDIEIDVPEEVKNSVIGVKG